MMPQGSFDIHLNEPVLFGMPNAAFSAEEVNEYFEAVLEQAKPLTHWVYFEHPQANAALSEEAVKAFLAHYQVLAQHGCIGIALQASEVVARVLRFEHELNSLPIPFHASRNQIELSKFVGKLAQSIEEDSIDGLVESA